MRSSSGASIVELLVALTVAGLVAAATLSVTLSSRELYASDRGRVELNQNLRLGLDLLGIDVRAAGQRLPADFPAIELLDGGAGNPDTLILRRNVLGSVLPLCAQIDSGTAVAEIRVAWSGGGAPPGCAPVADADADGRPDNLGEWHDQRIANGGSLAVYVFNPVTRLGEFVDFDGDGSTADFLSVTSSGSWQHTYRTNEQCRVYVLDERSYQLDGDVLQYRVNGDAANPVRLVDGLVDFQARVTRSDATVLDSFGPADAWIELRNVEVTLSGEAQAPRRTIRKTMATRFFPRQVRSP